MPKGVQKDLKSIEKVLKSIHVGIQNVSRMHKKSMLKSKPNQGSEISSKSIDFPERFRSAFRLHSDKNVSKKASTN